MGYRTIGTAAAAGAAVPPLFTYPASGFSAAAITGVLNGKDSERSFGTALDTFDQINLILRSSFARVLVFDLLVNGVVKVADVHVQLAANQNICLQFPLNVPSGQTLGIRVSANNATDAVRAAVIAGKKANDGATGMSSILALTATSLTPASNGASVQLGTGSNQLNTPIRISTSGSLVTSNALNTALKGLMLQFHNGSDGTRSASDYVIDIMTGASGAQTVLIPNISVYSATSLALLTPMPALRMDIASGTELWFRVNAYSPTPTEASDTFFCVAHGLVPS